MNEQQAHAQGLHFTGIYSSDKEEVKTRIANDRKKYSKARIVLVNVPHSKLSRSGPGMGYSAYADDIYSAYDLIEHAGDVHQDHADRMAAIEAEYKKKLAEEETRFTDLAAKVMTAREKIAAA